MVKTSAIDYGVKNKNLDKFHFVRTWCNRITKGCHGAVHKHTQPGASFTADLVMIYYYEAPPDSSSLVFLDNEVVVDNTKPYYEYPANKRYHLTPEPGMLVVHSPHIPHGVSTHGADANRTCLILEPKFENVFNVTRGIKL